MNEVIFACIIITVIPSKVYVYIYYLYEGKILFYTASR